MTLTATNSNNITRWSAPECWDVKIAKGVESDVYSFGVILWELLTRQIPWPNKELYQINEILSAGKTLDIPSHVPKNLREILLQCWQIGNFLTEINKFNFL